MSIDFAPNSLRPAPLSSLQERLGLDEARRAVSESEYADSLMPVVDAVRKDPERLWRPYDAVQIAKVVSAFNLDRTLRKAAGLDFAELLDRSRLDLALTRLGSGTSADAVAEAYWPPRTRAQQLKETQANVIVVDNKLSSRDNLDAALRRTIDLGLDAVAERLRP